MPVAGEQSPTRTRNSAASAKRPSVAERRAELADWSDAERRRVLEIYTGEVYGRPPEIDVDLSWQTLRESAGPAGSRRRQICLELRPRGGAATAQDRPNRPREESAPVEAGPPEGDLAPIRLTLLVQVPGAGADHPAADDPAPASQPVPAFLGLNFQGNHTLSMDPAILDATEIADVAGSALHYEGKISTADGPPPRGSKAEAWAAELIARRGYATITASYLEIGPDTPGLFATGLHPRLASAGTEDRPSDAGGAITLWAWVLQRILDALEQGMVPEVDTSQVIVHGHSRLGKTALWAAAHDQRFAAAISNDSGCMGAAIDRGVGEGHELITTAFPHWFAPCFTRRVAEGRGAPVDQHQLLATIAPRPLYVASASEDLHADPEGEFLAWKIAADVWGADASDVDFPSPDKAARVPGAPLGYHLRRGEHSVQHADWAQWLDFADRWVRRP